MAGPRKPKRPERPPSSTATGRMTLLLEQIQEQNRATIEAVFALEQRLEAKWEVRFARIEARLDALEVAVRLNTETLRQHSEILRQHTEMLRQHSDELRRQSEAIEGMRRDLNSQRALLERKGDTSRLEALEGRVSKLEAEVLRPGKL